MGVEHPGYILPLLQHKGSTIELLHVPRMRSYTKQRKQKACTADRLPFHMSSLALAANISV